MVLSCTTLLSGCDGVFFWGLPHRFPFADRLERRAVDVWFDSEDGTTLHGVWLDARVEWKGTVVYCHGNDRNLTRHTIWCDFLPDLGYDVLLFDYRGFGRSEGLPDREGVIADARAAIDLALRRDPDRVVVWGHSLGGTPAIIASSERPEVKGVIAQSPFSDWRRIAHDSGGWLLWPAVSLVVRDGDDAIDAVDRLGDRPLVLIHGDDDWVVPYSHSEDLRDAKTTGSVELITYEGAGHRSPIQATPERFRADIERSLERILGPRGQTR